MAKQLKITNEIGRIDKVLATAWSISRSQVQNWLHAQLVLVNTKPVKANYKVASGDEISVTIPEPKLLSAKPQDIPIEIVYEDADVLVVNKPQGMVVHPAPGHPDGTLVNALMAHTQLSSINGVIRPGIVHRIDKDTSGLLMVAKNDHAHLSLSEQLKAKTTTRAYYAIVHGVIKKEQGTIDEPLARAKNDRKKQAVVIGGRHAVTHYQVIKRFAHYTLIKCVLETGRTHQIRVHMAYIGHPIAADPLYGPKKSLPGNGQYLHAKTLGFVHPTTGKYLEFDSPLPDYFQKMLDWLQSHDANPNS